MIFLKILNVYPGTFIWRQVTIQQTKQRAGSNSLARCYNPRKL